MTLSTIASLQGMTPEHRETAVVHAQFVQLCEKIGRDQRPYYEASLADATGPVTFRIWSDAPELALVQEYQPGQFVQLEAEFHRHPSFGLEAKHWRLRPLTPEERQTALYGPLIEQQQRDLATIQSLADSIQDPRLKAICHQFLEEFGVRFRRTGAARGYHHARRGGLVEHVAQMMRDADAICGVRPTLDRDLLLAGVLFHDSGKLWENIYEEEGFSMPYSETAELLGHIAMGVELISILWRKIERPDWQTLEPSSDRVRRHLQHLVLSHHGEIAFGSPVVPKTPEAAALHYLDNLDAKLEMFAQGYKHAAKLGANVQERVRPLTGNLIAPLTTAAAPASAETSEPSEGAMD